MENSFHFRRNDEKTTLYQRKIVESKVVFLKLQVGNVKTVKS